MVCQLVCVRVAVVVGGRGGEHLAVMMGGHRLGLPEVGSHGRYKEVGVLTVRNEDKRGANDAEESQQRKREGRWSAASDSVRRSQRTPMDKAKVPKDKPTTSTHNG